LSLSLSRFYSSKIATTGSRVNFDKAREIFRTLSVPDYLDSAYLTGLRGYAALFVFLIHSGGLGLLHLSPLIDNFVSQGENGVIIFFVLSGYVISRSILNAKANFNLVSYWQRRALRILPLYFLVMVILAIPCALWPDFGGGYWRQELGVPHDLKSVLYHLSFYNLIDQRYAVNCIGVEWTIPVEFTFYLLIPVWIWTFQRKIHWSLGLLITSVFYLASYYSPNMLSTPLDDFTPQNLVGIKKHWSPYTYTPYFFLSSLMAFLVDKYRLENTDRRFSPLLQAALVLFIINSLHRFPGQQQLYGLMTLMIIAGCLQKSSLRTALFENRFVILLGKVSFSFYLFHFTLLNLWPFQDIALKAPVMFALTTLLSCASYEWIERPLSRLRLPYGSPPRPTSVNA